jgi:hypothetical protein
MSLNITSDLVKPRVVRAHQYRLASCLYGDGDDNECHRVVVGDGVADVETSKFGTSVGTNVTVSVETSEYADSQ